MQKIDFPPDERWIVGVSGGIAAYKTAELVRILTRRGHAVQVVLTASALQFVQPLTFQALTGKPVLHALFDPGNEKNGMDHIFLARWAQQILIAPASANVIARLAHGMADDLLTTLCLVTDAEITLAPAMNRLMWEHPATQDNVALLRRRGIQIIGPDQGLQACGEEGPGRMTEPESIVLSIMEHRSRSKCRPILPETRILITAGPTREPIDPVRFMSNRSSGRMGFALARHAKAMGARVCLIHGPVTLPMPQGVDSIAVETAGQMANAVFDQIGQCDIFISNAAVADYTPREVAGEKIKKQPGEISLSMIRTQDIIATVADGSKPPFLVGFAAESGDLVSYARNKLKHKKLDMIAANRIGDPGSGFGDQPNALHVLWNNGEVILPLQSKDSLARQLIELIAQRYHQCGERHHVEQHNTQR